MLKGTKNSIRVTNEKASRWEMIWAWAGMILMEVMMRSDQVLGLLKEELSGFGM